MDDLEEVDKVRQRLEENIAQLKKSLSLRQSWELEYEGLREEILNLKGQGGRKDLRAIFDNNESTLIDQNESKSLLGDSRNSEQVLDALSRRIDYVRLDTKSLEKRLQIASDILQTELRTVERRESSADNLPLTEILEELDEYGNVISSRTMLPGSEAPQLLESLEKAGAISEQKATKNNINHHPDQREAARETLGVSRKPQEATEASIKSVSASRSSAAGADIVKDYKFTTQQGQTGPTDPASDLSTASNDESSEDALLRQEMINYALHPPPHNIVAVMNLDDQVKSQSDKVNGDDHFEDDDDYDYSDELVGDEDEDVDDEEEEDSEDDVDSHGRTSSTILDERYIKRMEALQKKLGASDIKNIGPSAEPAPMQGKSPSETDSSKPTEQAEMSPLKAKKSVHFADNIDVATSSPRGPNPTASVPRTTRPISNDILKQKPSTSNPLSSTILERTPNPVQQPPSPATGLEANELATEYHRVRNRLIQREGGFVRTNDEEPETVPLEQPGAKKISRFRAARVGGATVNPPRF